MSGGTGRGDEAYRPPARTYHELPDHTRRFLENLREDEVKQLSESMDFIRSLHTVGRFTKWAVVTVVSTFIAGLTLYDKLRAFLGGGSHP